MFPQASPVAGPVGRDDAAGVEDGRAEADLRQEVPQDPPASVPLQRPPRHH